MFLSIVEKGIAIVCISLVEMLMMGDNVIGDSCQRAIDALFV